MQDVQLSLAFIVWAQRRDRASAGGGSNASTANEGLYSFKYHNKPASVDPSSSATVFAVPSTSTSSQSAEPDTIYASFPSTKQGVGKNKGKQVEHRFVGTEMQAKEVDVVLVWDEAAQCWSLEPLVSSISFKPDRTPNSKAPPTPPVPSAHELQSTTRAFFDSDATNPFAFVAAQPAAKNEDKPAAKRPKSSSSSSAPPPPGLASLLNPASSPSANGVLPPSAAQSEDEDDDMFEEVGVGESQPQVADVPSYLRTPGGGTAPLPDLAPVSAPLPVPPKPPSPLPPVAQPPSRPPAPPPSRPVASTQPEHPPPRPAQSKPASVPPRPHPSYGSKIPASYTRQLAQKAKEADEASSDSDDDEEDEYEDEDVQMRPIGASVDRPPAQGKKTAEADRTTRSGATFASAPVQAVHLGPSSKATPPARSTTASKSIQRVAPNISDSSSSDSSSDSDESDSGGVPSAVRAQMSRQVNAQMAKVRSGTGTPVPPAVPAGAGQRRVNYPSIQAAQAVQQQQARWQQQVQAQQQQRAAAAAAASAAGRPGPGQVGRKGLAPPVRTAASLDLRQAEIENDIPDSSEEE
ncbi:hypothetical protein NBRC10512_007589 [Rhodotorula toruloides]|uniref:RHTO0S09e08086g1_1 n=2 Tax=Rhodotorula toruloides TaxID=5286 RepID=A0A061BA22_RHOTO|nr:transcription elognation factor Eaf, N-terminal domain-containing protein [Rhodotorula toruloides NP11]EMS19850.1 transcription elognation factor Eaf, N-terminal domain-containing protein [Rhodotorula toruloides NP11]CDR44731.1 RHTO0S09e08086g1_1 [Rhodotorula toruloides]